ncbi:MAG TPA: DNA gyrase C-terminal beta-propeller domain-containing protein, partial [Dokdonella sp.]|nr:DNA gyrase C-terminal beta-propeller domain-containing protein [Dokdonella sp.]
LPSARGNGEPLSGRFSLPPGARIDTLAIADPATRLVLASDFGYGFVTRFEALLGNKKAGKQLINLDDKAHVLHPALVEDTARDRIVVVTSSGHLLMFSVAELPELDNGGKGNKLIEIPKPKLGAGERVVGVAVVAESKGEATLFAGQRKLILKWSDLVEYGGNRAARGSLLPRGFQRVDRIETTG